jgi:hypothetical protein
MNVYPGQRYQFPAWSDIWMRGERYGTVESVGTKAVVFRGDRSGRRVKVHVVMVLDDMELVA